jgi:hypothetical protein
MRSFVVFLCAVAVGASAFSLKTISSSRFTARRAAAPTCADGINAAVACLNGLNAGSASAFGRRLSGIDTCCGTLTGVANLCGVSYETAVAAVFDGFDTLYGQDAASAAQELLISCPRELCCCGCFGVPVRDLMTSFDVCGM